MILSSSIAGSSD